MTEVTPHGLGQDQKSVLKAKPLYIPANIGPVK